MIDLHLHSSCSDGTDSPEQLLEKVRKARLRYFALTDHDTIVGSRRIAALVAPSEGFIPGAEFSCVTPVRKCHILGYGFDLQNAEIEQMLANAAALRRRKVAMRLDFLQDNFGIDFTESEREWLFSLETAGKPHIAALLMQKGLAEDVGTAIRRYLNTAQLPDDRMDAGEMIAAIRRAGGIAVWAHPLGGEGAVHLSPDAFGQQLECLCRLGIQGLECFYSRYTLAECGFLCAEAARRHLCVSCGSDYHGDNKNISIGEINSAQIAVDIQKISLLNALNFH